MTTFKVQNYTCGVNLGRGRYQPSATIIDAGNAVYKVEFLQREAISAAPDAAINLLRAFLNQRAVAANAYHRITRVPA